MIVELKHYELIWEKDSSRSYLAPLDASKTWNE